MEAGATGPPNHTKAAPQLFGGDTGFPEGPDFRTEPPDWRSRWLRKPSCDIKTVKKSLQTITKEWYSKNTPSPSIAFSS